MNGHDGDDAIDGDARDPDHAVVDALLQEHLGALEPPDLAANVLAERTTARGARTAGLIACAEYGDDRAVPLWARVALWLLAIGAVFGAWWYSPATTTVHPVQEPAPQQPEVVEVHGLEQLRALLPHAVELEIEPWFLRPSMTDLRGAPPHRCGRELAQVIARGITAEAHAIPPAGWKWPHRLRFLLDDGRAVDAAIDESRAGAFGVHGLQGDAATGPGTASMVQAELRRAETEARVRRGIAMLRSEIADAKSSPLAACTALKVIDSGDPVTRILREDLCALQFGRATRLDLAAVPALVDGQLLANLPRSMPQLRELVLDGAAIDDDALRLLGAMPDLRGLSLRGCTSVRGDAFLQARDGPQAGPEPPFARLERLDLGGCAALRAYALPNLGAMPSLRELRLADVPLPPDDTRWRIFCGATRVATLDLAGHPFEENRLRDIAAIPSLRDLRLQSCELDDKDLEMLGRSKTPLRSLDLGGNPDLTADGLQPLVLALPGLRLLGLSGCVHVTEAQRRALVDRGLRIVDVVGDDLR